MPLVDKVKTGKLALTQQSIAREMQINPIQLDWHLIGYLVVALLVCWLAGIVDCLVKSEVDH